MNNTIRRFWNTESMVNIEDLRGSAFQAEEGGHTFQIKALDENGDVTALSGSVSAIFVRADNSDVILTGGVSGGVASVTLTDECYDVPGRFGLTIYLTSGVSKTAIYAAVGTVHRTSGGAVSPGTSEDIGDLIDAIEAAIASIPAGYPSLVANTSLQQYTDVEINGLTLGKTLSGGTYTDAASAVLDKRAATNIYFCAGDYIKVGVLSGYKVEIDFYDENHSYISDTGWITTETIVKSIGEYFRVLVGGDSSIESNYNSIASISFHGNLSATANRVDDIAKNYGEKVDLSGWISGEYPNFPTGQIWIGPDYKYVPKVRVTGGAKYYYTGEMNSACGIIFYDETKMLISGAGTNENTFTAPANARYADIGAKGVSTTPFLYCIGSEWDVSSEVSTNSVIAFTQEAGVVGPSTSVQDTGAHTIIDVEPHEEYLVTGHVYALGIFPLVVFYNGSTYLSYINGEDGTNTNYRVRVPENANKMLVNGKPYQIAIWKCINTVRDGVRDLYKRTNNLYNFSEKTLVWFGTSIPANGWFGNEHPNAYPQQVGRLLNATVINEAIGSSSIYCRDPALVTASNPYGFGGNFEGSSRCLTNSLEEMEWIIENWDSDIWTSNKPDEMDSWLANEIRNCSYERKLDQYLASGKFPDLFVFDHGFNDSDDVNNYYETYGPYNKFCFRGGMNFLLKRIMDYNPYANIIMIGNYTTTRQVPQMQEEVATDWGIPLYKQWEYLGLSLTQNVTASGYWNYNSTSKEYEWIEDSTERTYTVRDRLVPDHVHPHSNPTGLIVKKMAEGIAKWITANVVWYDNAE